MTISVQRTLTGELRYFKDGKRISREEAMRELARIEKGRELLELYREVAAGRIRRRYPVVRPRGIVKPTGLTIGEVAFLLGRVTGKPRPTARRAGVAPLTRREIFELLEQYVLVPPAKRPPVQFPVRPAIPPALYRPPPPRMPLPSGAVIPLGELEGALRRLPKGGQIRFEFKFDGKDMVGFIRRLDDVWEYLSTVRRIKQRVVEREQKFATEVPVSPPAGAEVVRVERKEKAGVPVWVYTLRYRTVIPERFEERYEHTSDPKVVVEAVKRFNPRLIQVV